MLSPSLYLPSTRDRMEMTRSCVRPEAAGGCVMAPKLLQHYFYYHHHHCYHQYHHHHQRSRRRRWGCWSPRTPLLQIESAGSWGSGVNITVATLLFWLNLYLVNFSTYHHSLGIKRQIMAKLFSNPLNFIDYDFSFRYFTHNAAFARTCEQIVISPQQWKVIIQFSDKFNQDETNLMDWERILFSRQWDEFKLVYKIRDGESFETESDLNTDFDSAGRRTW